jgi:BirA family biotin operon repressor/biotin-[acetyl-CoA-carboxylase] ligase
MIKEDILRLLMQSTSGHVSGGELAKRLKVSRTAIWKHIKALEDDGYGIAAVPSKGYRLMTIPDKLILHDIEGDLSTKIVGRNIHLLAEVPSTNSRAMEAAQEGAADGTVVIAETQTGGKGRLGRTWVSPKGNLYLSVILRPPIPPHKAPLLTLMGAVAAASAIRKQLDVRAEIKWPNDIFVAGRKLGGLLTEMSAEPDRVRFIVLGIGLNVNMELAELPPEIRSLSTTLSAEAGGPVPRTELLRRVLVELDRWYQVFLRNEALVLREWETLNMTLGKRVTVVGLGETSEGTAQGIDHDGRLILKLDDGSLRQVAAGDVTIVKK